MTQRYLTEIKNELSQIGFQNIEHSAPNSEILSRYYSEIFSESLCTTCRGKLAEAYYKILNLTSQNSNIMAKGKFSLKNPDQFIDTGYNPIEGVPIHVNNSNITDEIHDKLIKSNPNFKTQFVEDPNYVAPEGESKSKKATEVPEGTSSRYDEVMEMTKEEISKKLDKAKVSYNSNAPKAELAQLLVDSEGK